MSNEGCLGAYVDPQGHVFEIMTVHTVNGLFPFEEYGFNWFPGYTCRNALCGRCGYRVGWHFTTTNEILRPGTFWGLEILQMAEEQIPQMEL
ncbi:protein cereblon [Trifolium pratense]|uniref:Protein cereblon n=1 Tax=Trifolium pratense TaxID=57577 RepID=A0A2K3K0S7_TRIPR|nr:protein cereblon [Trifolium pratense]